MRWEGGTKHIVVKTAVKESTTNVLKTLTVEEPEDAQQFP